MKYFLVKIDLVITLLNTLAADFYPIFASYKTRNFYKN